MGSPTSSEQAGASVIMPNDLPHWKTYRYDIYDPAIKWRFGGRLHSTRHQFGV